MLILTRNCGQAIRIGDDMEIKVLSLNGSQVSLGIEAPMDVDIHREEVYQRIQEQKKNTDPATS